ncbi:MAG: magnesium-dependent phosphatase-1 [Breznakibacter sp.]
MGKKLFVFDLDFTLWDAGGTWCDCTIPPFRMVNGRLLDAEGAHIRVYDDVQKILDTLKKNGKHIGIASRTTSPKIARELMKIFGIRPYVDYEEIFPDTKTSHFIQIAAKSRIDFSDMVFFDDEYRNIHDVSLLGVDCVHITNGIAFDRILPYI